MFREQFTYEFVTSSASPDSTKMLLKRLLRIVLDATLIFSRTSQAGLLNGQICMLIIRCFVDSLDNEWIAIDGLFR